MGDTFLDALTEEEVADLHAAGRRRAYGPGVTLFPEGDDSGPVVVILAGRVKVATVGGGGREAIVAVRGPGDLIGELSAIDGGPRSATVTTLEPAEVLLVPGSAFAALLERQLRIALVLLAWWRAACGTPTCSRPSSPRRTWSAVWPRVCSSSATASAWPRTTGS